MSSCLDDLVRDPARAGLLSSEERQALLAQVVALLNAGNRAQKILFGPPDGTGLDGTVQVVINIVQLALKPARAPPRAAA